MDHKSISRNLYRWMQKAGDYEYLLSLISHHCGPAIEGVKASSLLNIRNTEKRGLYDVWLANKQEILDFFNISAFCLKKSNEGEVVLMFHPHLLEKQLNDLSNIDFLSRFGYESQWDMEGYLTYLKTRFEHCCPHEIGVFLGYALSDVIDFISCPNKECRLVGYWKVYSNEASARELFRRFDEAKFHSFKKTIGRLATYSYPVLMAGSSS